MFLIIPEGITHHQNIVSENTLSLCLLGVFISKLFAKEIHVYRPAYKGYGGLKQHVEPKI